MNVLELFRRLSYGELSNLAIGIEGVGAISEDAQPRIVNYANEALLRLHSRFLLKESLLFLEQVDHLTYYYLLKRFARSQLTNPPYPDTPHNYILDSASEPFQDDVIKVLQVVNQESVELPLNDSENTESIFTPQPNLIQVPNPRHGQVMVVSYQARHPLLSYDDKREEIDLPYVLEGALMTYIAYKIFSHMNGQDNAAKASEHLSVYEQICGEVEAHDTVSQSISHTNIKFYARGFC